MATDWITGIGSAVVGVAGVAFGWASAVRSQRQTAELAREGNRHAQALAEATAGQARDLEELRYEQSRGDRRAQRLEESYLEIATTVIRLSAILSDDDASLPDDADALVRARVLIGLFAQPDVRDAFEQWRKHIDSLRFALHRRAAIDDPDPPGTRDLQSPRDLWRRKARDARLREIDAREILIRAMAQQLSHP